MRFLAGLILAFTLSTSALAAKGPGREAVRSMWVKAVADYVVFKNDHARRWDGPSAPQMAVPTTWKEVPAKFKGPRIMKQLRALAEMPTVTLMTNGGLAGVDPARQIERNVRPTSIKTNYRGGIFQGGQTWDISSLGMPVEQAELRHDWTVGARGAKKTGQAIGSDGVRWADPKSSIFHGVSDADVKHAATQVAGGLDPMAAMLQMMISARQ